MKRHPPRRRLRETTVALPAPDLLPSSPASGHTEPLLDVSNLTVSFRSSKRMVRAVTSLSFQLHSGKALGIVGESGSGKSVTALAIARLLPGNAHVKGEVLWRGRSVLGMRNADLRRYQGREVGMIFQDPMTSLNPTQSIGRQVAERARYNLGLSHRQSMRHAAELLGRVGIPRPAERLGDYPHQFSGGMRQRAMIAMAISCEPALLIADEATTALDVTMQAQILRLLSDLAQEVNSSVIFITHDLAVASEVCDEMQVMYAGEVVERGPAHSIFTKPRMPYTQALMDCISTLDDDLTSPFRPIPGLPPDPSDPIDGCRFALRCEHRGERCKEHPSLTVREEGQRHLARCWATETGGWLT